MALEVRGMATDQSRAVRLSPARGFLFAGILVVACAAHPTEPTAPFGLGVSLYPDSLYRGKGVTIDGDVSNLTDLRGPCGDSDHGDTHYDNCISSLRIPAGWSATVFRDSKFSGASATYTRMCPISTW